MESSAASSPVTVSGTSLKTGYFVVHVLLPRGYPLRALVWPGSQLPEVQEAATRRGVDRFRAFLPRRAPEQQQLEQ